MVNLNDVLLAMSNIPVDDPIAEIWGRGLQSGYKIIEYTGALPITINANGDALIDYRIYGADGGVGEVTENLIDADNPGSQRVELEPNTDYCFCKYSGSQVGRPQCNVYDENDNKLFGDYIGVWVSYSFTNPSNGAYAIITFLADVKGKLSFAKGRAVNTSSLYPANYIPYGYKLPMMTRGENLFDPNDPDIERGYYYGYNNSISTAYGDNAWESGWIPVTPGDYTFYLRKLMVGFYLYVNFYNSQKEFVKTIVGVTNPNGFYTRTINDVGYVRFNGINVYSTDWMVARGNVTTYTPYSRTDTTVYIGENQLDAGEYVSFGEQKIYRDVDGTITPTDPPVPLPDIPTIKGETIIDYDGTPKPSQMYVKYKGKAVQ